MISKFRMVLQKYHDIEIRPWPYPEVRRKGTWNFRSSQIIVVNEMKEMNESCRRNSPLPLSPSERQALCQILGLLDQGSYHYSKFLALETWYHVFWKCLWNLNNFYQCSSGFFKLSIIMSKNGLNLKILKIVDMRYPFGSWKWVLAQHHHSWWLTIRMWYLFSATSSNLFNTL